MGSRKENLKKSLGITEYPWSSDDDEDALPPPAPEVVQRSNRDPRPSVADLPGTSGVQPTQSQPSTTSTSPATARKIQARLDRDLFWSIINNTSRPYSNASNASSQLPRSRVNTASMGAASRPTAPPPRSRLDVNAPEQRTAPRRGDRQTPSVDVSRILAFKKLTRSLQNLAQARAAVPNSTQRASNSAQSTPRPNRPADRPAPPRQAQAQNVAARPTLFTPAFPVNNNGYNYNSPWRQSLPAYPNDTQPVTTEPWQYTEPEPVQEAPETSTSEAVPTYSNMPTFADEGIAVPPPVIQKIEPNDDTPENHEEENLEEPVHNDTGSGARLIEEVVEVDAPDGGEGNPPPPGTEVEEQLPEEQMEQIPTEENNASGVSGNSVENEVQPEEGSAYHGVKRKRDEAEETSDTFSVQDFNQSLLRLLECPVCLEWMEPPISQCRRGHLVCSRCRARLAACPVCRTPFSSVRNRAMEGVAEMLRYPCRHGCGREVRLRKRAPHEASCDSRRYHCPAPPCARHPPLPRAELAHHFQCKHLPILKIGNKHKFSMKVNSEQHDTWLIMAQDEYFHLRVDVDIRTWGVIVYVAYIGPKRNAKYFTYEVTVEGQHNARKLVYTRSAHSDLESSSLNVSRQDCFHLTLDQALNFLRFKNRHCEPDKFLDFDVEITKWDVPEESNASKDDSES